MGRGYLDFSEQPELEELLKMYEDLAFPDIFRLKILFYVLDRKINLIGLVDEKILSLIEKAHESYSEGLNHELSNEEGLASRRIFSGIKCLANCLDYQYNLLLASPLR